MKTSILAIAAFALCGILISASAALGPRSPENLDKSATLIITGVSTNVVASTEGDADSSDWVATIDARIETVIKGSAKEGATIKIRCWRPKDRPDGWTGPQGHYDIPAKGSKFKMWLSKREDNLWQPLEPNGIELRNGDAVFGFTKKKEEKKPGFFRRLFGR